jgi:serine phosphatase RsbU (regulator of sigma subunit)
MAETHPTTSRRSWDAERDLLVLFTDGFSDARNRAGQRLGEEPLLATIAKYQAEPPASILGHVIELVERHTGGAPRRDDQTLVLLRS